MDEHFLLGLALQALGITPQGYGGSTIDELVIVPELEFDREALRLKLDEIRQTKALEQLRIERNKRLADCDWAGMTDYPFASEEQRQAWLDYRQALRDLPANSPNVTINESGALVGVAWPQTPQ